MPNSLPSEVVGVLDSAFGELPASKDWHIQVNPPVAASLSAVLRMFNDIPAHLLRFSSHDRYLCFRSIEYIRDCIERYAHPTVVHGHAIIPVNLAQVDGENPAYTLRHLLAKCSDSVPSPSTTALPCFGKTKLREALRSELSDVNSALVNSEWRAATVLGGATLEAILYWALRGSSAEITALPVKPPRSLDKWKFDEIIKVAEEIKIIEPETRLQADLARRSRNLVHPAKVVRSRRECDRASSLAVVAAIEGVVRDLNRAAITLGRPF